MACIHRAIVKVCKRDEGEAERRLSDGQAEGEHLPTTARTVTHTAVANYLTEIAFSLLLLAFLHTGGKLKNQAENVQKKPSAVTESA